MDRSGRVDRAQEEAALDLGASFPQVFWHILLPFLKPGTNVMMLANHGTVSYGTDVERAYWWTEILDAYCRMLILSKQLGRVTYFTEDKEREL